MKRSGKSFVLYIVKRCTPKITEMFRYDRFNLTLRAVSNKKTRSPEERLPEVQKFHRWVKTLRNSEPQRDPKYGRFPAEDTYASDQIPLEFGKFGKKTYNPKGAKSVRLKVPKGNLDKRVATLQLTFRAAPPQNVPPTILFRGVPETRANGTTNPAMPKAAVLKKELPRYENLELNVRWQKKAWVDLPTGIQNLKDVKKHTPKNEKLHSMDNLSAQCHPEFKRYAKTRDNTMLAYTAGKSCAVFRKYFFKIFNTPYLQTGEAFGRIFLRNGKVSDSPSQTVQPKIFQGFSFFSLLFSFHLHSSPSHIIIHGISTFLKLFNKKFLSFSEKVQIGVEKLREPTPIKEGNALKFCIFFFMRKSKKQNACGNVRGYFWGD